MKQTMKCKKGPNCTVKNCKYDHSTETDSDKRSLLQRQLSTSPSGAKSNAEQQSSPSFEPKKKVVKMKPPQEQDDEELTWRSYRPQLKKYLNILFFGSSGTGKSSTINNFLTLGSSKNNVIHKAAPRTNETEQMTKKFECFSMNSYIRLYDCWGWTRGANYKQGEFKKMLDGQLQLGHSMDSTKFSSAVNYDNVVDALIMVVDAKRALEEENQFFLDAKQFAEEARREGAVVVFAITKVDVLDGLVGKVRVLPSPQAAKREINNNPDFKSIRDKIKKFCPHEDIRVMPVINYEPEENDKDEIMSSTVETILDYIVEKVATKKEVSFEGQHKVFDLFSSEEVLKFQYDH